MRVWDLPAGYLNRGSLLGEHRELHGIASIIANGKRGYSRHPETLRWTRCERGLAHRHLLLVAEMQLRGYRHASPLPASVEPPRWPRAFVTEPAEQFALLKSKYRTRESGRILLPRTTQELWAQHKYSVMARDPELYRDLGRRVSKLRRTAGFAELTKELVAIMRRVPSRRRAFNALEHMWGHVSRHASADDRRAAQADPATLLRETQRLAIELREPFICGSTALSELAVYVDPNG